MQKPVLHTLLSPRLLDLYDVTNSIVVIIDVFRATSTITTALYNGAEKVVPVAGVEDCISTGKKLGAVTAGERDGKIIPGLQHGNSPAEYPRSFIEGKTLVLTTTNGTRLLHMALDRNVAEVITGSFPNLSAVCEHLASSDKNVILGCSAWKDRFNLEDTLFAGAVINRVKEHFTIHCDSSLAAEYLYNQNKSDLLSFAKNFTHYHRLVSRFGYIEDIEYCLTEDNANILPLYQDGKLVAFTS